MTDAYHQQVLAQLDEARADRRSLEDEVALLRQRAALALAVLNGWGPAGHEAEQMRHEIREALTYPTGPCTIAPPIPLTQRGHIGPCILTGPHTEHRDASGCQWTPIRPELFAKKVPFPNPELGPVEREAEMRAKVRAILGAAFTETPTTTNNWTPDRTEIGPRSATLHVSVPAQVDNQVDNRRGFTVGVYFPPEAPDAVRDAFFDRVAADAHSLDRSDWDAFVIGLAGDPLDIDAEQDGP